MLFAITSVIMINDAGNLTNQLTSFGAYLNISGFSAVSDRCRSVFAAERLKKT